jgi:P4 family phage/plasmid primase-like protien
MRRSARPDCGRNATTIRRTLRWGKYSGRYGEALVFPFFDVAGNRLHDYSRIKFTKSRTKGKGAKARKVKYESPLGAPNRPYFPPGCAKELADKAKPIIIAEGEKKSLMAMQMLRERAVTIGLIGVYGWNKPRKKDESGKAEGEWELLPDLAAIDWADRHVFIVFDSDAVTNVAVCWAEYNLAATLRRHGAIVKIVRLPPGPVGADGIQAKQGLDDYLVASLVADFWALVEKAEDPQKPEGTATANEAPDDPDRLARGYLDVHCRTKAGERKLRYWRESFYSWDETVYNEAADAEINADVHRFVKTEFDRINKAAMEKWLLKGQNGPAPVVIKITRGLITNVLDAMRSIVILPNVTEPMVWLDADVGKSENVLAMENGILNLDALFAHQANVLMPHSANWFSTTKFPYAFDPSANCPKWLAFLKRNQQEDEERIALVQEWFGLNLIHDTTYHKFLVLEGEGSNGKSVICAVLEALLGKRNCSFVPLEIFGQRFQLTPTIGKLANIVAECAELDKVSEGFLKSFVTADSMTFDVKNKTPLQCRPTARLTLAFNNRPRFSDRSSGLWRRMILMPMLVVIPKEEQVKGMDKPEWWAQQGELPGVFLWSLVGLARLRSQGHFTASKICEDALLGYQLESNPARIFLVEACTVNTDGEVVCKELYAAYKQWVSSNGYSPLADGKFGVEVRRAFPKVRRGQRGKTWCYFGITADFLGM